MEIRREKNIEQNGSNPPSTETPFEKIINGSEKEKELAMQKLQEIFTKKDEELSKYEIEKSPEDLELIKKTESIVDRVIKRYGGKLKPIPPDNIYLLRPGSVSEITEGRLVGGVHRPLGAKIGVEKRESNLMLASCIAHELFHSKSYHSARTAKSAEDIRPFRSGLAMRDRKNPDAARGSEKEYFSMLEEAIVAECTKKFLDKIGEDEQFKEEVDAMKRFKSWVMGYFKRMELPPEHIMAINEEIIYIPDVRVFVDRVLKERPDEESRQEYAAGVLRALHDSNRVETVERIRERKLLYGVLDKIISKSGGKFKDRESIFTEFAKANFSGKYLPLARIIEKTIGRGAFRELAEKSSS